jgi:tRNA threonylcarbamoyladenosine biosynthesis protein TsaE
MFSSPPLLLPTLDETERLARLLACALAPGDVLLLQGPLGAGKTALSQALIKALVGADVVVPSPTFTLVNPYETTQGPLWHADLYRLTSEEVPTLGLEEHWWTGLTLIEWPERLPYLPEAPLWISLAHDRLSQERTAHLTGNTLWSKRLSFLNTF